MDFPHRHPIAVAVTTGIMTLFLGYVSGQDSQAPVQPRISPSVVRSTTTVTATPTPTPAPTVTVTEQATETITAPVQYAGAGSGTDQGTGTGQVSDAGGQDDSVVYYANCSAAKAAGAAPLHRREPGYRSGLDRDGDGIACEWS